MTTTLLSLLLLQQLRFTLKSVRSWHGVERDRLKPHEELSLTTAKPSRGAPCHLKTRPTSSLQSRHSFQNHIGVPRCLVAIAEQPSKSCLLLFLHKLTRQICGEPIVMLHIIRNESTAWKHSLILWMAYLSWRSRHISLKRNCSDTQITSVKTHKNSWKPNMVIKVWSL